MPSSLEIAESLDIQAIVLMIHGNTGTGCADVITVGPAVSITPQLAREVIPAVKVALSPPAPVSRNLQRPPLGS